MQQHKSFVKKVLYYRKRMNSQLVKDKGARTIVDVSELR